jgi:hypothetical protein
VGICKTDEGVLDATGKGFPPDQRRRVPIALGRVGPKRRYPDASHAGKSGITCADMSGFRGNDLGDSGWTLAEAASERLEVGELVVNSLRKLDSALVVHPKCFLEMGEHAGASRDSKGHAAKFTQELVPLLHSDAAASLEQVEQRLDTFHSVRRQLDRASDGVNQPSEDGL